MLLANIYSKGKSLFGTLKLIGLTAMLKGYFGLCNPNCPVLSGGFYNNPRNTGQTLSAMIL
jgi:hypothetical protein